jgi:NhaA family Na+:H+ antiporter
MPIFAFANAGVSLGQISLDGDGLWVFSASCWADDRQACRHRECRGLPAASAAVLPASPLAADRGRRMVGGIGFTMALFIAQLAFQGPLLETAKLAIVCASGLAGALALFVGHRVLKKA